MFNFRQSKRKTARRDSRPAYSYYSNASQPSEAVRQRQQAGQKRVWIRRLRLMPSALAVMAIIFSVVYSTTLTTTAKVNVVGNASPYRNIDDYRLYMDSLLKQSFLAKSKLTINTSRLESDLIKKYPEIHYANLSLPVIGRRPTLTITVHEPFILMTTKNRALVVDSNGKAVSEPATLNSSALDSLLKLQDESGQNIESGAQALSLPTVTFIKNLNYQLNLKNLIVTQLTLPPSKAHELDIRLKEASYYIKTDISGDARQQAGAFLAVKEKLENEGGNISEYVDVRVEEKVFYK